MFLIKLRANLIHNYSDILLVIYISDIFKLWIFNNKKLLLFLIFEAEYAQFLKINIRFSLKLNDFNNYFLTKNLLRYVA